MDKPLFKLILLKEASSFIEELPDKVREKVFYNLRKVRFGVQDRELFKKLEVIYGSSARLGRVWLTACSHFGDDDGETLGVAVSMVAKKVS